MPYGNTVCNKKKIKIAPLLFPDARAIKLKQVIPMFVYWSKDESPYSFDAT